MRFLNGAFVALLVVFASFTPALSQPFEEAIQSVLQSHPRIKAAQADLDAALEDEKTSFASWYPNFDLDGHYGYEKILKEESSDTSLMTREVELAMTQKLWDFGVTNTEIDIARLTIRQREKVLAATKDELLLESVRAYLDLRRLHKIKQFAVESESNIQEITKLETIRVEKGQGYSTDVLQAKTQLAAAQARRVQVDGALTGALNRYKAVFGKGGINPAEMEDIGIPEALMPKTLDEAIEFAQKNNPELAVASLVTNILEMKAESIKKDAFTPDIDFVLSGGIGEGVDGSTTGRKSDYKAVVQFSIPFNGGLRELNQIKSAQHSRNAANMRYSETQDLIVEEVSQAWQTMMTAKNNAQLLDNQANLAEQFLTLSRKERQLGRRSLLDILSGETSLINARSDAMSAHVEVVIASYKLLKAIGNIQG